MVAWCLGEGRVRPKWDAWPRVTGQLFLKKAEVWLEPVDEEGLGWRRAGGMNRDPSEGQAQACGAREHGGSRDWSAGQRESCKMLNTVSAQHRSPWRLADPVWILSTLCHCSSLCAWHLGGPQQIPVKWKMSYSRCAQKRKTNPNSF